MRLAAMGLVVCFAGMLGERATGQVVAWERPYYGEVAQSDLGGAIGRGQFVPIPYHSYAPVDVMRISELGEDGVVIAGGAETDPYASFYDFRTTPYVTKLSRRDGREIWHWQPDPQHPPYGRVWNMAADAAGNLIACGNTNGHPDDLGSFLLAKVDGGTGATLWQLAGPPDTQCYATVVDANGDVLMTSRDPSFARIPGTVPWSTPERISKISGSTGAVIWTTTMPDGLSDADDFLLALDASGNAIAVGRYTIETSPNVQAFGSQMGKFRASDGASLWQRRTADPDPWGEMTAVRTLSGGDVLIQGNYRRMRLRGSDGHLVWQRSDPEPAAALAVDASDRIFIAGPFYGGPLATVSGIDPATGAMLWTTQLPAVGTYMYSSTVVFDREGNLLVSSQADGGSMNMSIALVNPATGEVSWSARLGATGPDFDTQTTVGIVQSREGSIFVGSYAADPDEDGNTWGVFKVTGSFSDDVFANAFE